MATCLVFRAICVELGAHFALIESRHRVRCSAGSAGDAATPSAGEVGCVRCASMNYDNQGRGWASAGVGTAARPRAGSLVSDALWMTYRWMALGLGITGSSRCSSRISPAAIESSSATASSSTACSSRSSGSSWLQLASPRARARPPSAAMFFAYAALTGVTFSTSSFSSTRRRRSRGCSSSPPARSPVCRVFGAVTKTGSQRRRSLRALRAHRPHHRVAS